VEELNFSIKERINLNSYSDSKGWRGYCERNKFPFILLKDINKDYTEIFYDITNFNADLKYISKEISDIFNSYRKFTLIDNYFWEKYSGQYYFFTFPVMKKHSEIIAEQLFNYLLRYLENSK